MQVLLLSKGRNFVSTCNSIVEIKLKLKLEAFGRIFDYSVFFVGRICIRNVRTQICF